MLQAIPAGLPRDKARELIKAATSDSQALTRDQGEWTFAPLAIADISFALWHRSHPLGFIAHADLGDRVVAAWGEGNLPPEILRMQLMELTA
jgi:hypothetical protein